jgi:hypothetical protein
MFFLHIVQKNFEVTFLGQHIALAMFFFLVQNFAKMQEIKVKGNILAQYFFFSEKKKPKFEDFYFFEKDFATFGLCFF